MTLLHLFTVIDKYFVPSLTKGREFVSYSSIYAPTDSGLFGLNVCLLLAEGV